MLGRARRLWLVNVPSVLYGSCVQNVAELGNLKGASARWGETLVPKMVWRSLATAYPWGRQDLPGLTGRPHQQGPGRPRDLQQTGNVSILEIGGRRESATLKRKRCRVVERVE